MTTIKNMMNDKDGRTLEVSIPEALIRGINESVLVNQMNEISKDNIDTWHLMQLVDTYSKIMSFGVQVYNEKFSEKDIVLMRASMQGYIPFSNDVEDTTIGFIDNLLESHRVDDLLGEVEVDNDVINLVSKITKGDNINNINIYSLVQLLTFMKVNHRGASAEDYKKNFELYLKLVE